MKKILLTVSFVVVSVLLSSNASSQVVFGLKAGADMAWMPGTALIDSEMTYKKPHFGAYGGVSAMLETAGSLFFQGELLYAGKGYRDKFISPTYNERFAINLHYLELPLYVGTKLADDRYFLMLGPQIAYCFAGTESTDNTITGKNSIKCERYRPFQVDIALQTTYMVTDLLGVDVKFEFGLTRVLDDIMYKGKNWEKGHNMAVSVGLSYRFD